MLNSERRGRRLLGARQRIGLLLVLAAIAGGCGSRQDHDLHVSALEKTAARAAASAREDAEDLSTPGGGLATDLAPGSATDTDTSNGTGGGTALPNSGSGSGATGGPAAASGSAAASCPRQLSTINIGTVGEQSGIAGSAVGPGTKAVAAWVAMVNARGGVLCHPLKYIVADDGSDPATHQALMQKLVEDDRILAVVYMNAVIPGRASFEYLKRMGVPVIGNEGGSAFFYEAPNYFPQQSTGDGSLKALVSTAVQIGKDRKLGTLSCIEAPSCARLLQTGEQYSEELGIDLVYAGQASIAQPDYTSVCQAAQGAGVQTWIVVLDPNSVKRLARSCRSVGYAPQYIVYGGSSNAETGDDPNLNGVVVGMPNLPWTVTSHPAIAEFLQAMAEHAPGGRPEPITLTAWVAAKLFERGLRDIKEPITREALLEQLWSIKGEDLGGITQPLTFAEGKNAPAGPVCNWIVQSIDRVWQTPYGIDRVCV